MYVCTVFKWCMIPLKKDRCLSLLSTVSFLVDHVWRKTALNADSKGGMRDEPSKILGQPVFRRDVLLDETWECGTICSAHQTWFKLHHSIIWRFSWGYPQIIHLNRTGTPKMDGLEWKCHLYMDDDWGVPPFLDTPGVSAAPATAPAAASAVPSARQSRPTHRWGPRGLVGEPRPGDDWNSKVFKTPAGWW